MTFDETNAKILALLQHDSSLTNEAIGREVNLSSTAVIKRVRKLRDSGVIEATVAVLSVQSAGPLVNALVLCAFDPDGAATAADWGPAVPSGVALSPLVEIPVVPLGEPGKAIAGDLA